MEEVESDESVVIRYRAPNRLREVLHVLEDCFFEDFLPSESGGISAGTALD